MINDALLCRFCGSGLHVEPANGLPGDPDMIVCDLTRSCGAEWDGSALLVTEGRPRWCRCGPEIHRRTLADLRYCSVNAAVLRNTAPRRPEGMDEHPPPRYSVPTHRLFGTEPP